jgi:hypothetical protein
MNATALILYFLITAYITIYVGKVLNKNGRFFLLEMLGEEKITDSVNRLLLVGYYLINLGYVTTMLTVRPPVNSMEDLISSLASSVGRIILTLGVIHYLNIAAAVFWKKSKSH